MQKNLSSQTEKEKLTASPELRNSWEFDEKNGNLFGSDIKKNSENFEKRSAERKRNGMTRSQKILETLNEARQFLVDAEIDRDQILKMEETVREENRKENEGEQLDQKLKEHIDSIFSKDSQKGESKIHLTDYVGKSKEDRRRETKVHELAKENEIMIIRKESSDLVEQGKYFLIFQIYVK